MGEIWARVVEHWQFLAGAALALIGIGLTIWAVFYQRQPKRLDYNILTDLQIVRFQTTREFPELRVTYKDRSVYDPRIVVIRIQNTGKRAVTESDFDGGQPISIHYKGDPFLAARITSEPPGFKASQETLPGKIVPHSAIRHSGTLQLIPNLLNPGEWFDVQLISDGDHGDIAVSARFADQARPMRLYVPPPRFSRRVLLAYIGVTTLLGVIVGLAGYWASREASEIITLADGTVYFTNSGPSWLGGVGFITGAIVAIGAMIWLPRFISTSRDDS